ncbi:GNAT family N-acetyltransferase [Rhodococcus zopfii]|uniref:GNAT family N-acetyltransferase n=1 Tax=Rhodococcus zopfii TaxID=43772 RepID=UPI001F105339|nr:GNAT family N-acetyltransferase [Rhodococcus zopfii]
MGDDLMEAMELNLASHAGHLHPTVASATVRDPGDILIVDSGLDDDTFNLVCRARMAPLTAQARLEEILATVRAAGRPFSWWVAPTSTPANLGELLRERGLRASETELAMTASMTEIPLPAPDTNLKVVTVTNREQLRHYAELMARNWTPPSPAVFDFFEAAGSAILRSECASTFVVGYLAGEPVAGAEIHLAAGVAGLYGVVTLETHRRRGFGTAVTLAAVERVRAAGVERVVLQASEDGAPVYERIGFTPVGTYTEYALRR